LVRDGVNLRPLSKVVHGADKSSSYLLTHWSSMLGVVHW
jgi:hypothetical protein